MVPFRGTSDSIRSRCPDASKALESTTEDGIRIEAASRHPREDDEDEPCIDQRGTVGGSLQFATSHRSRVKLSPSGHCVRSALLIQERVS